MTHAARVWNRCRRKKRYQTREAATFFASARIQRAYPCGDCRGWHLTSSLKELI